jgi:hypothetical protein
MSALEKMKVMGRRVGLPQALISEIYIMGLSAAMKSGRLQVDLELMAKAIKYASDNAHMLQPKWQYLIKLQG